MDSDVIHSIARAIRGLSLALGNLHDKTQMMEYLEYAQENVNYAIQKVGSNK